MGKRQEAAQETRKKVIYAAANLIKEKGFDNVSVADIAAAAGVAKGTFYTYFERKEDVVDEITRHNFTAVEELSRAIEDNVYRQIKEFIVGSIKRIVEVGLKLAQQWVAGTMDPEHSLGHAKLDYDLNMVREAIANAAARGELASDTEADALHELITAEYYGALLCWCISDGAFDPISLLERYCESQLKPILDAKKPR